MLKYGDEGQSSQEQSSREESLQEQSLSSSEESTDLFMNTSNGNLTA